MSLEYDLIVIGGGSVGLSVAYHASKRGRKVLVLEKFGVLNNRGSSAGASRQFRLQYAQQYMSELSLASQNYWADLQSYNSRTLIRQNGSLWFGDPNLSSQEGGIAAAEAVMDKLSIPYTHLDAAEIQRQYAFKNIPKDYCGFFQPNGGIINLKASEEALYDAAIYSGLVDIHEYEEVTAIQSLSSGEITVTTEIAGYTCEKMAVCTGPYANQTLELLGLQLGISLWQMSSAYFRKKDPSLHLPTWFVFQKPKDSALFYGFPEVDWSHEGYLRVATDFHDRILSHVSERTFKPSIKSLKLNSEWVSKHMTGLDETAHFTSTCLIAIPTNSERELLLDYLPSSLPNHKNIVVYTAGWAGKYFPILGDMINQMLTEDLTNFNYGKYQIPRVNFNIEWQQKCDS